MKILKTLFLNILLGSVFAGLMGVNPVYGSGIGFCAGFLIPSVGGLKATIFREVWTGETIKTFRSSIESIGWLNRLQNRDKYADNDVIHFIDLGGDPDVLVNNSSYPIEIQELKDGDKVVSLDKYQTKVTPITDDELYASSYDKMATVIERHKESVNETKIARACHALAPAEHTTTTPVILTTGEAEEGRKMMTRKDILSLKKSFDKAKVPSGDRILVLCEDHVNDLLNSDQKFADQFYNYTTGKVANIYGFEIYEYVGCPYFDATTKKKIPFAAIPTASQYKASVAFYAKDCIRVSGSTKTYLSKAEDNPETQQNLFNLRHYFIALPLQNRALGAIVSASV